MFPRISNFISKISHHIPSMLFSSAQASEAKPVQASTPQQLKKLEQRSYDTKEKDCGSSSDAKVMLEGYNGKPMLFGKQGCVLDSGDNLNSLEKLY